MSARVFLLNKTLCDRALRRCGCGINCECKGMVRNYIFPDTLRHKYPYFSPLSNRCLMSASRRGHLRLYPVSNSVMKNLYAITFRQIPRFDYNFCHN